MKGFTRVVQDINSGLNKAIYFPVFLDACLAFLVCFLIMILIGWPIWLSFIPMVAVFVRSWRKRGHINRIRMVEMYYPELNEKLRTAVDYADQDGIVIDELHQEVIEQVGNVRTAAFFDIGKTTTKSISCVILCFIILLLVSLNLPLDDYRAKIKNAVNDIEQSFGGGTSQFDESSSAGKGKGKDIFGDRSIATLGNKELEVRIKPSTFELNIRNIKDAEEKQFEDAFPSDVAVSTSSTYEEKIPQEQQIIVKNYFKNLAGGNRP